MGFSVSGATAILLLGLFVSFSMFYTSVDNGRDTVDDARQDETDALLDQRNTELTITNATYASSTLTIEVENAGSTTLEIDATDVLVDNRYQTNDDVTERTIVGESRATNLWLPGETLRIEVEVDARPDRIKVVAGTGVAATESNIGGS